MFASHNRDRLSVLKNGTMRDQRKEQVVTPQASLPSEDGTDFEWLDFNLSLTVAERFEKHNRGLRFARALRENADRTQSR